jgi:hypothetical protein
MSPYVPVDSLIIPSSSRSVDHGGAGGAILSGGADSVEHDFDRTLGGDMNGCVPMSADDLATLGDVELIDELSLLTTQTARMRARMADLIAELDRRRTRATGSRAVSC